MPLRSCSATTWSFEFLRHPLELGDHRLDLRDLPALLLDLEALQADEHLHATSSTQLPTRPGCSTTGLVRAVTGGSRISA